MIIPYMASGLLAAAVCTDLICRRVPNHLVMLGMITGCYLCICSYGLQAGGLIFLKSVVFPFCILFPVYLLGAVGAGDVKLIAALSAMTGGARIGSLILISFLIGALTALARMLLSGQLFYRCRRLAGHWKECILSHNISRYQTIEEPESYLHFTVCIYLAFLALYFWEVIF